MFEGLLKNKFQTKCKTAIKTTKTRVEMIKKKRNAMQKFLKNDITDLLKNGLDNNAYGRVEGLYNEMTFSSCYDFVEQFCVHLSSNISEMNKQRECPEECREAAASLMFAAARFADLPELRDLRNVFAERYGNSIECYANKEFVHKLKCTPPTKEMKLQLMQEIATEYGVEWNVKSLEQKLSNPPAVRHNNKNGNAGERDALERIEAVPSMDHNVAEHKHEDPGRHASPGMKEQQSHVAQVASVEEQYDMKPFNLKGIRPPYYKSNVNKSDVKTDPSNHREGSEHKDENNHAVKEDVPHQDDPVDEAKSIPKSVRRRNQKLQQVQEKVDGSEPENGEKQGRRWWRSSNNRKNDHQDAEEKTMDRLLHHYARKKLPPDAGKPESVLEPSSDRVYEGKENDKSGIRTRKGSLPVDLGHVDTSSQGHARARSLQPEMLNGHVHPKLPDYEDFVARLAAQRGNSK